MYVAHCTQSCTRMICGTPSSMSRERLSPERAIAPKGHRLREPHVTRSERSRGRKNGCSEAFGVGAAARSCSDAVSVIFAVVALIGGLELILVGCTQMVAGASNRSRFLLVKTPHASA